MRKQFEKLIHLAATLHYAVMTLNDPCSDEHVGVPFIDEEKLRYYIDANDFRDNNPEPYYTVTLRDLDEAIEVSPKYKSVELKLVHADDLDATVKAFEGAVMEAVRKLYQK